MNRAREQHIAKAREIVLRDAKRLGIEYSAEELEEAALDLYHEWVAEDAAFREMQEDSPCLESCDSGSGEGRYHGRIG